MGKYIDAEKLKAEIERRKELLENGTGHPEVMKRVEGVLKGYNSILDFIALQQKQPDVDLNWEEELDKFYGMYRDRDGNTYNIEDNSPCTDWKEDCNPEFEIKFARYFWNKGFSSRKEK